MLSYVQQQIGKKIPGTNQATSLKARRKIITFIKYLGGSQMFKTEKAGEMGKYYLMGNEPAFIQ